jgi:predicted methyltransferase
MNNPDKGWLLRLESEQWKSNVTKMVGELDGMSYPIQLDAAMMVLFYHDIIWQGVDRKVMNRHIFNALKPGGSFLIIDHSAKSGTGLSDVESLHRIDKQSIIDDLTSVGFKLEVDSDLLAMASDKRDFPFWKNPAKKRDHTDRLVLKFVKPVN